MDLEATEVVGTYGTLMAPLDLSVDPTIPLLDAVSRARTEGNGRLIGRPRVFVDQRLSYDGAPRLVWRVSFAGAVAEAVSVDAHDGTVLTRVPLVQDHEPDQDFEEFDANGGNADDDCFIFTGDHIGSEHGLAKAYHGDLDAVNGWHFGGYAYWWFHAVFDRHGFDGDDDQLELFVHAQVDNGRWNRGCELMEYTNGWVQQDIVVHEYTHGILDNNEWNDGLEYLNQSGALNEAYSDLMGVLSDPDYDWTIGEDVPGVQGGALRDFANPARTDLAGPPFQPRPTRRTT